MRISKENWKSKKSREMKMAKKMKKINDQLIKWSFWLKILKKKLIKN
jgi:hypothetical protein